MAPLTSARHVVVSRAQAELLTFSVRIIDAAAISRNCHTRPPALPLGKSAVLYPHKWMTMNYILKEI